MKAFLALFFATTLSVAAQTPQVPHKMQFADITLTIRDDARREIQKDVDAFTKYPKSFNIKVERAKTYFPVIEKIFAEENVPDDFKYLVIQESALVADAVSVSNAVGFWQFKDFTAMEMGLRIDKEIDERLNIVSSSRAAARYLKKNNGLFDNWLYTLQSYQMGAGGVMRSEKESKSGVKHMEITSNTYWYVRKYLAHKIAYESAIKGKGEIQLLAYHNRTKKTLGELAKEVSIDEEELKSYNKWTKSGKIPDDRDYTVVIPIRGSMNTINLPESVIASTSGLSSPIKPKESIKASKKEASVKINGINTIKAVEGDTPSKLASRANADISSFLKWNDISISDRIQPGAYYLLGKKRTRASKAYHQVSPGENLWAVSQKYGIQIKKLRKYNRLSASAEVAPGTTLWLASLKPKGSDKPVAKDDIVEVDNRATFAWAVTPESKEEQSSAKDVATVREEKVIFAEDKAVKPVYEDSVETLQAKNTVNPAPDSIKQLPAEEIVVRKNEHVVLAGETLYGIAKLYNVGVMDLVSWNNLNLQHGIKPGQVIKLTGPELVTQEDKPSVSETATEHTVAASDTVYSIARKYGVTIKELMEWNNKKDFNISVGERLKIPKK